MNCSIDICTNKKHANLYGEPYCSKHYSRLTRYGRLSTVRKMHGAHSNPLYSHWKAMMTRCYNPKSNTYKNYGGRGIRVCERWRESALNFYEDMGNKPSAAHTVDRIDVDGDYQPDNCRWATPAEQSRNRRTSTKNKSGVTGVAWDKSRSKWIASLMVNGISVLQKRYDDIEDAIVARKEAENKYW